MNIFVLDNDPVKSAQMMCDKHVVKMIVETAQMLSTVHRYLDGQQYIDVSANNRRIKRWNHPNHDQFLYKSVMLNHPCTVWARTSHMNYNWLAVHGTALCNEYEHRYKSIHLTTPLMMWLRTHQPSNIAHGDLTQFAQAMPDQYRVEGDAVQAYRNYYIGEKAGFAKWTNREIPEWFTLTQCA
jgi:hypothetical protein